MYLWRGSACKIYRRKSPERRFFGRGFSEGESAERLRSEPSGFRPVERLGEPGILKGTEQTWVDAGFCDGWISAGDDSVKRHFSCSRRLHFVTNLC